MSSLIVRRLLASNYQANNHYNRAGAKCPIFLVMMSLFHYLYTNTFEIVSDVMFYIRSNFKDAVFHFLHVLNVIDTD